MKTVLRGYGRANQAFLDLLDPLEESILRGDGPGFEARLQAVAVALADHRMRDESVLFPALLRGVKAEFGRLVRRHGQECAVSLPWTVSQADFLCELLRLQGEHEFAESLVADLRGPVWTSESGKIHPDARDGAAILVRLLRNHLITESARVLPELKRSMLWTQDAPPVDPGTTRARLAGRPRPVGFERSVRAADARGHASRDRGRRAGNATGAYAPPRRNAPRPPTAS